MKHFSLMDRPQSHSDLSASHLKLRLGFLPVNALLNAFAAMTIKLMSVVERTLKNNLPTNTFIPHGFC